MASAISNAPVDACYEVTCNECNKKTWAVSFFLPPLSVPVLFWDCRPKPPIPDSFSLDKININILILIHLFTYFLLQGCGAHKEKVLQNIAPENLCTCPRN